MNKLSVVIITLNEEKNIRRCLESVKEIADEIIIVDSYSTDATVQIAEEYGATVFLQNFLGYGAQKNLANRQATYDWILSLDADEELTPVLRESIARIKHEPAFNAYQFSRLTNYCGKWIKHSGWYPDKKVRLYNKHKGQWYSEQIHEHWELYDDTEKVGEIKGDLLHYSYHSISDHIIRIEKFTELSSLAAVENGKKCSLLKLWFVPKWNFFRDYIMRLGFLDGAAGYTICKFTYYTYFVKYTKIRQYAFLKRYGKLF